MTKLHRAIATVLTALTVTVGVAAVAAPAHADTSWGYRVQR